jgi:hypothetical protein
MPRSIDDLVVDVGDVAHIGHVVTQHTQPAVDHIEGHHHACMTHVAQVIDRDAAHIHADPAGLQRLEGLEPARERVVDAEGHAAKGERPRRGGRSLESKPV